jgi:hypothetical protein
MDFIWPVWTSSGRYGLNLAGMRLHLAGMRLHLAGMHLHFGISITMPYRVMPTVGFRRAFSRHLEHSQQSKCRGRFQMSFKPQSLRHSVWVVIGLVKVECLADTFEPARDCAVLSRD